MANFPCLGCGKTWTGHRRAHCATCHENFSSTSAFDRHRINFVCLKPWERGLILKDGYWAWAATNRAFTARRQGKVAHV
jgi:hypothetical protein